MGDDWKDDPVPDTSEAVVSVADMPEVKLFGKWSCDEVNISDMSLQVSTPPWRLLVEVNFAKLLFRITLLSRRSLPSLCLTALDVMLPSGSGRPSVQLLKGLSIPS